MANLLVKSLRARTRERLDATLFENRRHFHVVRKRGSDSPVLADEVTQELFVILTRARWKADRLRAHRSD